MKTAEQSGENEFAGLEPAAAAIAGIFNARFSCPPYFTKLEPGEDEPYYLPRRHDNDHDRVVFAKGFAASALHEVAHWCIAGSARRRLKDYGYWYVPEGRDDNAQHEFLNVESRPQALEWLFSLAAMRPFYISCDDFSATSPSLSLMRGRVISACKDYLASGLPARGAFFLSDLQDYYGSRRFFRESVAEILRGKLKPG